MPVTWPVTVPSYTRSHGIHVHPLRAIDRLSLVRGKDPTDARAARRDRIVVEGRVRRARARAARGIRAHARRGSRTGRERSEEESGTPARTRTRRAEGSGERAGEGPRRRAAGRIGVAQARAGARAEAGRL